MIVNIMRNRLLTFLFIISGICFSAGAQTTEKTPYYISMNTADGQRIHDISDETLSLQYHDSFGRWKQVPIKIYNWKRELVTTLNVDKEYGLNSFVVKLKDVYAGWELHKTYMCELKDESGRQYQLPIRLVSPPDKKDPEVNILVNPLQTACDGLSQNVVEFYGEIKGGKSPYTINWYVLNSNKTDFLYQPRQEIIDAPGKTMVISVDKDPDYYVVLYVKDACGNSQQKIVNMSCEENRKKINSIFVEEFSSPLLNPKKIK